jgi:hypothetical protein
VTCQFTETGEQNLSGMILLALDKSLQSCPDMTDDMIIIKNEKK